MISIITLTPSAAIDYAEIVDPHTFESSAAVSSGDLAMLAVFIGSVRLIDNIMF
jgi:pantothenate synthetase